MMLKEIIRPVYNISLFALFRLFGLLPLQDKVIIRSFKGKKYGDNPKYILEELHRIAPEVKCLCVNATGVSFGTPDYIQEISRNIVCQLYQYATAKVWIDTAQYNAYWVKRRGQLFVETWHGGLGIKKIDLDVDKFQARKNLRQTNIKTMEMADVCISNSAFMSRVYRSALHYQGEISMCGNAKGDILHISNSEICKKVKDFFCLQENTRIAVYAPTYRDPELKKILNYNTIADIYSVDFECLQSNLKKRFGGDWKILIRLHPNYSSKDIDELAQSDAAIDAMEYPDMQELILASDVFLSDYSSCIFEAAERRIPCFTFATDFEEYKRDRGVYYEMNELPFSFAKTNEELTDNILNFDQKEYEKKWEQFAQNNGLVITDQSSRFIAENIKKFIDGEDISWDFESWKARQIEQSKYREGNYGNKQ